MRHYHLLNLGSLAGLAVLFGCDGSSVTSPSAESSPTSVASASRPRPWKESYQASGTITRDVTRCPDPQLLVTLTGGGTATHIGRYTIINSHCVDPTTGDLTAGTFVKTAANGDQIFGSYVGSSIVLQEPAPVGIFSVNGTITFTGGTGRFAGATGTTNMSGTLDADFSQVPVAAQSSLTMVGTISY